MVRIRQLAKFCTATRRAFGNELVGGLAYGFGHLIARLFEHLERQRRRTRGKIENAHSATPYS